MVQRLTYNFFLIVLFLFGCDDLEDELQKDLSATASNSMFRLELVVENDVTDQDTAIPFEVNVTRIDSYTVRSDAQVLGFWTLYYMEVNSEVQNVSQYPVDIEFFEDNSFSKQVHNTVTGETTYIGGDWTFDSGSLSLTSLGVTSTISTTFDNPGPVVPLDGFMMWDYNDDGDTYYEVYQKTIEPDNYFDEPFTYLYLDASGGEISGTTYNDPSEIEAIIENKKNAQFTVMGSFEPGLDFDTGSIVVSLYNEDHGTITVSMDIKIKIGD